MVNGMRGVLLGLLAGVVVLAVLPADGTPGASPEAPAPAQHTSDAACSHCHEDVHQGAVGTTCQECHTSETWVPSTFGLTDHANTKFALTGKHATAECSLCHPNARLAGQPLECAGCHLDRHRGKLGENCAECHSTERFAPVEGFDHAGRTGFALTGPHGGDVSCDDCHTGPRGRLLQVAVEPGCATCHAPSHGDFGACESCHPADRTTFAGASFDHRSTSFALERRHAAQSCASCHPAGSVGSDARSDCQACHTDVHAGQTGSVCTDCHRPDRWRLVRFDHDATSVPLRGSHFVASCTSCHTNQRWIGLPRDCFGCHSGEARRGPSSVPAHVTGIGECGDCHNSWTW